jgi:ABC-type bacteriocin/lantibiotic exporter with double-glycine peptidase domain
VTPAEVGQRLGCGDDYPRTWVVVEPTLAEAASDPDHKLSPERRLLALVRADRVDIATIVVYAVFVGLLSLATPIAVQQLVNSVAFGGLVQPVVVLALLLMVGLGFAALLSTLQAYAVEIIQRRVFVRACVDLAERLPRVEIGAFGNRHAPELVNRFFDLVTLQKTGATLLLAGTAVVLQTVTGLMILSFYHPLMFGFSLVLIAAIAFVVVVLGRGATRSAIGESGAKYELAGWMEELVRTPALFRSRAGRRHAARRADELATAWVDARQRHFRIVLRQIAASLGLQVVANAAVLALGGFLVVSGQLTLGQLVASEIIVAAVVAAFARMGKLMESYYDLLAAVDKVGVLLDLPLERVDGSAPTPHAGPAVVEARDVEIEPEGAGGGERMSLHIEAGERVGLSGPSGSGKSALLSVLCGLRRPRHGTVLFDGEDIELLHLESFREQAMLLRDIEIHTGSIIDNVRVARPSASIVEVETALARVGLSKAVERLPDGYRTKLSPSGRPLSSGHARQLMLARALVAQPRLLVVDDEMAHFDSEAAARVMDVLFDEGAPWSLVVVSHDPEWLERCDRVIEMPGPPRAPDVPGASSADAAHGDASPSDESESKGAA